MDLKAMFKKDYIVGLDTGTSSIKLAQFIKKEDSLYLIKTGLEEIASPVIARPTKSAEAISERARNDKEEQILSTLKKLLRGIDIKKSKFIVSINCPKTYTRKVTVPHMPRGELVEGIKLEAKNYFPFLIDEALLDLEILGNIVEKGAKKYQLLIATSPKKTVDGYISLLNKVGIKPSSFIPVPLALQKTIEATQPKKDEVKAILDIGEQFTELSIIDGGKLVFSRKIPVVAGDFTKVMTGVLVSDRGKTELSLDEAEKIKREVGIPPEAESKMIEDKISTTQILSMLRTPLEQLVNEIDRCFDYYREETGGGKIDSLVLFGGGASLKGLPEYLSKELDIEVKVGNPLEGLKIEPGAIVEKEKVSHRLASAIGAGLSEARGINLLPPEIKEETKRTFKRTTVETAAIAIILIFTFIYIGMRIQLTNFQRRISTATMELSSLQPQLEKLKAQSLVSSVLADEPYWKDVFKELSNIIPRDIYLTELSMKNKAITMGGIVVSERGEELLSDFILTLERGIFKNVKLVSTKDLQEKVGNEFDLKCWVD